MLFVPPNTPAFSNASSPSYVVHIWAECFESCDEVKPQPNIGFSNTVESVDFEVQGGNPGAVALHNRGAQGTTIEDVRVTLAEDALAGIMGLPGSGGASANVTVVGGRYGIDGRGAQPGPTISGIRLLGQRCAGLVYGGLSSLAATGLHIQTARLGDGSGPQPPAVVAGCPVGGQLWTNASDPTGCQLHTDLRIIQPCVGAVSGQLSLVDADLQVGSYQLPGRAQVPATRHVGSHVASAAVITTRSVVLQNAWIRGANVSVALEQDDGLPLHGGASDLPGPGTESSGVASRVRFWARGLLPPLYARGNRTWQYTAPAVVNGTLHETGTSVGGMSLCSVATSTWLQHSTLRGMVPHSLPPCELPSNLVDRHTFGPTRTFPSWEALYDPSAKGHAFNVKDFGAIGDGKSDDYAAITAALGQAKRITEAYAESNHSSAVPLPVVVLPRGAYNVSSTIRVPCGVALVGVGRVFSRINSAANARFVAPAVALPAPVGGTTQGPVLLVEECDSSQSIASRQEGGSPDDTGVQGTSRTDGPPALGTVLSHMLMELFNPDSAHINASVVLWLGGFRGGQRQRTVG